MWEELVWAQPAPSPRRGATENGQRTQSIAGDGHTPQATAVHGKNIVHRGEEREADADQWMQKQLPTTGKAVDRKATTATDAQACKPRDGGRRP